MSKNGRPCSGGQSIGSKKLSVAVARRAQTARRSDPALQLAPHDGLDHLHARWTVIEAGNVGEVLAAIFMEQFACFTSDFLKRFEAVGDKSGIDDGNPL
jgi:hypothetical protein